jgi:hypothetical protein
MGRVGIWGAENKVLGVNDTKQGMEMRGHREGEIT